MTDFVNSSFSPDGNVSFQNVYIYGTLHYDFEDQDLTLKSLNVTGKTILNDDIDLSGNLNVNNDAKITGIATFNNIEITGKLTDGNGDTGTAGQVLSTDGTDLEWINTSSANVGSASKVGINLDSDSTTSMFMTFVDSTSGNEEIRVDKSLTYKPSTGSFLGIATFTNIHITAGVKDTSGDVGSSGQVLSATGTAGGGTNWINVGDIAAGTASSISVTANSANKDQYIPFINETSGTQQVRADAGLKYNPNTDTLKPGRISLADDDEIRFGTNNDLKISHTDSLSGQNDSNGDSVLAGTNWCSYIKETGTGPLVFKTDGGPSSGAFQFYDTSWRPILKLFSGTGARTALYYAGSEKLITSNTGVTVTGTVAATSFTGSGASLTGVEGVPSGCILLWSGAANAIPSGWVLCDGSNSTPDLKGKFVVGYHASDGDYDVNDTGGATTVTLSTSQIPAHSHDDGSLSADNDTHNHRAGYWSGSFGGSSGATVFRVDAGSSNLAPTDQIKDDTHNHNVSGSTGNRGGGGSHENRPPYYALCYIMKT